MHSKKILIACYSLPYASEQGHEWVDLALLLSSFNHDVTLWFTGSGVLQLLKAKEVEGDIKSIQKKLSALPIYGISNIWIDQASIKKYNIEKLDLSVEGQKKDRQQVMSQLSHFDMTLLGDA